MTPVAKQVGGLSPYKKSLDMVSVQAVAGLIINKAMRGFLEDMTVDLSDPNGLLEEYWGQHLCSGITLKCSGKMARSERIFLRLLFTSREG